MKIDIHAHTVPRSVSAAAEGAPWHGLDVRQTATGALELHDRARVSKLPGWSGRDHLEDRLARMDSAGVDVQVLSVTWRLFGYHLEPDRATAIARDLNDDLARVVEEHPGRFLAFAQLPLQDPSAAVRELERAMAYPGVVGAAVGTDVGGLEWDAPELFQVLEAARDLRAVVFFHPADRKADARLERYHLRNLIGNPMETTVALASLIFGGVLDRLPGAAFAFAHAGGFATFGVGRFDHGYSVRPESRTPQRMPSDYLRSLYFDSIAWSDLAMRHLVDVAGATQVVMGSDDPADMGPADPVAFVNGCASLTDVEKDAITGGNLTRLLTELGHLQATT